MQKLPRIALTGATGFVGKALLPELVRQAASAAALARPLKGRALLPSPGLTWVPGDLETNSALETLSADANVMIHLAGVTKAKDAQKFHRVNAEQAARLAGIARQAGVGHFVHVSSLTAIRPDVSAYARSKADGERLVEDAAGDMPLTIIRAPAILGPGDEATVQVFSMLARGILAVPGGAAGRFRFSIMDVLDLSKFILHLAMSPPAPRQTLTPAGHLDVSWDGIAASASRVLGRPVRQVRLAPGLMRSAGYLSDIAGKLSSKPQVFSGGKVRELLSGDWIAEAAVSEAIPLDQTLARCLAPFLTSARQTRAGGRETHRSEA
ncbi:MAG: NAD-dependent epimerase/dehydratase family protein [Hyphomonas sp.]